MTPLLLWGLAQGAVVDHVGAALEDRVVWTSTAQMEPGERCIPLATGGEACAGRPGGTAMLTTEQPFPHDRVVVPLAAEGLQRIRFKGGVVQPEGLVRSLTGHSTVGVTSGQRRRLDRALDGPLRPPPGAALYVDPRSVAPDGIPARIARRAVRAHTATVGALGSLLGLGLLGIAYRRLEVQARRERIDTWFAERTADEEQP